MSYPPSKHILPGNRKISVFISQGGEISPAPDLFLDTINDPGIPHGALQYPHTGWYDESVGVNAETQKDIPGDRGIEASKFFEAVFDIIFIGLHNSNCLIQVSVTILGGELNSFRNGDMNMLLVTPE